MSALIKIVRSPHKQVYMYIYVYPDRVERLLKIDSKSLQKAIDLNQRTRMKTFLRADKSLQDILLESRRELREMVQTALSNKQQNKVVRPVKTANGHTFASSVKPVPADISVEPTKMESRASTKTEKKTSKPRARYTGKVLSCGIAKRVQGERTFDQYRVVLESDELDGHPQEIWGADLEPTIKKNNVNIGDYVEIVHIGKSQVNIDKDDGTRKIKWKNIYQITQIHAH